MNKGQNQEEINCRHCDKRIPKEGLQKHVDNFHKIIKCRICDGLFDTSEKYIEHIKEKHNGQDKQIFLCEKCAAPFKNVEQLTNHTKTFCGTVSPFECKVCNKKFQYEANLKAHKSVHTGDKNFACSYCSNRFRTKIQVVVHERKHTGEKPFKCNVCPKAFSYRESLVTHSVTHTGLKPYLCECCSLTFSCVSTILAHRRTRPDTCGLPEYCKTLAKACPRLKLKKISDKMTENDIKKRAVKVLKESDTKRIKTDTFSHIIDDENKKELFDLDKNYSNTKIETKQSKSRKSKRISEIKDLQKESSFTIDRSLDFDILTNSTKEVTSLNAQNSKLNTYYKNDDNITFKCAECEQIYTNRNRCYTKHLKNDHKKNDSEIESILSKQTNQPRSDLSCKICGKMYRYSRTLNEHLKAHGINESIILLCDFCTKTFTSQNDKNCHIQDFHKSELICTICKRSYISFKSLRDHLRYAHENHGKKAKRMKLISDLKNKSKLTNDSEHSLQFDADSTDSFEDQVSPISQQPDSDRVLIEQEPDKNTSSTSILNLEIKEDSENKDPVTNKIDESMSLRSEIKVDIQEFETSKLISKLNCDFCTKSFIYKKDKECHIQDCHKSEIICTTCKRSYKSFKSLRDHINYAHANYGKKAEKRKLNSKSKITNDSLQFDVESNDSFDDQASPISHQTDGDKFLIEQEPDKGSSSASILNLEIKEDSENKDLIKIKIDESMPLRSEIKDDTQDVETSKLSFNLNCDFCTKTFMYKKDKECHIQNYHKSQIICTTCKRSYKSFKSLRDHFRYAHENIDKKAKKNKLSSDLRHKSKINNDLEDPLHFDAESNDSFEDQLSPNVHQTENENSLTEQEPYKDCFSTSILNLEVKEDSVKNKINESMLLISEIKIETEEFETRKLSSELNCDFCTKTFIYKKDKECHIQDCHKSKIICTTCKRSYKSFKSLRDHISYAHANYGKKAEKRKLSYKLKNKSNISSDSEDSLQFDAESSDSFDDQSPPNAHQTDDDNSLTEQEPYNDCSSTSILNLQIKKDSEYKDPVENKINESMLLSEIKVEPEEFGTILDNTLNNIDLNLVKNEIDETENKRENTSTYECCECKKIYAQANRYEKHLRLFHKKSKAEINIILPNVNLSNKDLICKHCGKIFKFRKIFQQHLKIHGITEPLPLPCDFCEKTFTGQNEKNIHMEQNHQKELSCRTCSKVYRNLKALQDHVYYAHAGGHNHRKLKKNKDSENHSKQLDISEVQLDAYKNDTKNILECVDCKKIYTHPVMYERHLKTHHKKSESDIQDILPDFIQSKIECKICGVLFQFPKYLRKHLKRSHDVHDCDFCNNTFTSHTDKSLHIKNNHQNELTCKTCNKLCKNLRSLKTHIYSKHTKQRTTTPAKKYICPKCGKIFPTLTFLTNHETSNCGKDPNFECTECKKKLYTRRSLALHMLIHSGELPFSCSYCGKRFRSKHPCLVHQRIHTGEKPYNCTHCEKKFAYRDNLLIHISTHTGIKRYQCVSCSNRFSCVSGLKAHWRTHADTCGMHPDKSVKASTFLGIRKGKLSFKKDS